MSTPRKSLVTAGLFYLLTFVSIPTFSLYRGIHQPGYLAGPGDDAVVIIGVLLEVVVALGCIGSAVALYPVLKKQQDTLALSLVASRVLEAATILVGLAFLLTVVSLRQNGAGNDALPTARALVILYDRMFLLGQSFMPAVNDLLLGYLLYRSRLVPRALSVIGMAGAFPLIAGYLAIMTGLIDRQSPWAGLSALPVAGFEFSLGIYLIVLGTRGITLSKSTR